MKRSTDRILVSHVGSLARPRDLMEMLVARNEGKPFDAEALARRTRDAVAEVVAVVREVRAPLHHLALAHGGAGGVL